MTAQDPMYAKRWRLDRHRGIPRLVDPAPVRHHVHALQAQGMSACGIAAAAGVSKVVVCRIAKPEHTARVQSRVATAILAVTGPLDVLDADAVPEAFVPRWHAVRRIEALLALGWRHCDLRAESGVLTAVVLHQAGRWVTAPTHAAVCDAYERLCMTPGPSQRTRDRAARAGYLPPLAWDGIDDADEWPTLRDEEEAS